MPLVVGGKHASGRSGLVSGNDRHRRRRATLVADSLLVLGSRGARAVDKLSFQLGSQTLGSTPGDVSRILEGSVLDFFID